MTSNIFTPVEIDRITLSNRITMEPLYLGYADEGGTVSPLLLEHYRMMASGGAAMIMVESVMPSMSARGAAQAALSWPIPTRTCKGSPGWRQQ